MAKRKSAYSAVLREAQQKDGETVTLSDSETETLFYRETAEQLHGNTVTRQYVETGEELGKASLYITALQAEKLDDLAHDYKKRTGQRINRNDIVRYLIDQATLDSLAGIKRHVKKQGQK